MAAVLTGVVLATASCGSGDSAAADSSSPAHHANSSTTPKRHSPLDRPAGPSTPRPSKGRIGATVHGAAGMSEWLPFGPLAVRVVGYQRAGAKGGSRDRIDVVTVEECADSGSGLVRHTTWHLIDADGRILGTAGGKMVGGHPTEDIPRQLSSGECVQTGLAIAVPPDSVPAAVKDGPTNTWILAD